MTHEEVLEWEARVCKSSKCMAEATVRAHWPGQPTSMCEAHAGHAVGVAQVMGFELVVEPLYVWEDRERVKRLVADAERRLGG